MSNMTMQSFYAATLVIVGGCTQPPLPAGSENAIAEELILHELGSSGSYLAANRRLCPCFVRVGNRDLPPSELSKLSGTGILFLPGSKWVVGKGMEITIGLPDRRWNGDLTVTHSYYCSPLCASSATATLRYDGVKWRVLRSELKLIS
jgi:hypothetical protein